MSMVALTPAHCCRKESSADSESSPHQESSVSFNAHSTDSCLSDSLTGEGDDERWVALSSALLGQFECGMEYIEADLQGELAEASSLSVNAEELKPPNHSHFKSPSLKVATIVACKSCTLPKGQTSTGVV